MQAPPPSLRALRKIIPILGIVLASKATSIWAAAVMIIGIYLWMILNESKAE